MTGLSCKLQVGGQQEKANLVQKSIVLVSYYFLKCLFNKLAINGQLT